MLVVVQFIVSLFVKSNHPKNAVFEPLAYFKHLKQNKEHRDKLKYAYYNALLAGIKTTYQIIVIILTVYTFKTNFSLGILSSLFSLGAMILLMLYKKFDPSPKLNKFVVYLLLGVVPFLTCIVLVVWLNPVTLIIYNLSLTITVQFSDYLGTCERDAIIKHLDLYNYIAEHQFLYELCMCIARVLSYAIFVVVGLIGNILAFKIMLIVFLFANVVKHHMMYKQRKIRKEFEVEYFKQKKLEENEQNTDEVRA